MKRMIIAEIILAVLLLAASIIALIATCWYRDLSRCFADQGEYIDQLEEDNKLLLADKLDLCRENEKLRSDNDVLADAVRELRERDAAYSQQEDPEPAAVKEDEILQANAISSKERLPEGHTNVISGMPYTTITDKKSEQWALQLQAFTGKYGIRCYFDGDRIYFLAAMGSAYGRTIGDAFRVTLKCGTALYVMLGEFKDDGTDPNFFGHPTTHADGYDVTCVLEFIYDAEHINSKALQAGNFCNIECFGGLHGYGGDIVKIEYIGRKWEP